MEDMLGKLTTTSGRVLFGEIVLVNEETGVTCIVRDGKIVSWTTFLSPREALRAAREVEDDERARTAQARVAEPTGDVFTPEQRRASKRRARLKRFARGDGES